MSTRGPAVESDVPTWTLAVGALLSVQLGWTALAHDVARDEPELPVAALGPT